MEEIHEGPMFHLGTKGENDDNDDGVSTRDLMFVKLTILYFGFLDHPF